jgi:hypothetical protein
VVTPAGNHDALAQQGFRRPVGFYKKNGRFLKKKVAKISQAEQTFIAWPGNRTTAEPVSNQPRG